MQGLGIGDDVQTRQKKSRLGFFARIKRGWQLTKLGIAVVRADPELMVYVLLSGVFSIVASVVFIVFSFGTEMLIGNSDEEIAFNVVNLGITFVGYLVIAVITVFWNAAIVASAHHRLTTGENPSFSYGIGQAMKCLPQIFVWGIISGTIGVILKLLEGMAQDAKFPVNLIFGIVTFLIGTAWWVVTFFMIPLIVLEKAGVKECFVTSPKLFKKTWGENIGAVGGAGIINFLVILLIVAVSVPLFFLGNVGAGLGILFVILGVGLSILFFTTVDAVGRASMYYYAKTGELPPLAAQLGISFSD